MYIEMYIVFANDLKLKKKDASLFPFPATRTQ